MALRHIFFWPVCALLLTEVVLLGTMRQASRHEIHFTFGAGVSIFLLDLWALKWVGMWQSLFGKSIERVLFTTILRVLAVPWLFFLLAMTIVAASSPFTGISLESAQVVIVWWVISGVVGLVLGLTARAGFLNYFRSAAAQQFEVANKAPGSVTRWAGELASKFPISARLTRRLPAPVREHWILSSVSAVLLLILLSTFIRQFYWHTRLQSELALVRKANLPSTLLDIAQFDPPVPAHQNAIEALRKAGPPQLRGFQYSAGSSGILETQLAANRGQLAAFRSLTNFSKAYIAPSQGGPFLFFAFFPSQNYAQIGWLDMAIAADTHDVPRAIRAAESFIAFSKALRQNPSPDLQMMCAQQLAEFARGLENLLREDILDAETLASLQVKIAAIDDPEALAKTLAYARWRAIAATQQNWGGFGPAPGARILFAAVTGFLNSTGSTDKFLTEYLRAMDGSLALTGLPLHESIDAARKIEKSLNFRVPRIGFPMAHHNTFDIDAFFELEASLRTRLAILETAVAIERYRRRNGKLPENLPQLVPGFLSAVPIDAFSGDPLFYQNRMLSTISMDRRFNPPWRSRAPRADMMFRFDRR